LIRRSGYTDDDIANLMAGFYEPVGLPHLDDYKFIDMDAERRKKRREVELEKQAEMAKRWVRKVDEQGFAHAVGRRKTSNARVWIKEGRGRIVINKMHHDMYFPSMDDRVQYLEPFVVTDTVGMFDTFVLVRGGGTTGTCFLMVFACLDNIKNLFMSLFCLYKDCIWHKLFMPEKNWICMIMLLM
jgi:hypothetical protein